MVIRFIAVSLLLAVACRFARCQETPKPAAPDGQAIFQERCAVCHGADGGGVNTVVTIAGPSLKAEHDFGEVMTALETGPSHMPVFAYVLTVPEMRAVAGFVTQKIAVMPLKGGDVVEGGELFRIYCAACHRSAVRGGALAYTGDNAPPLVDKSPAIIAGAIRWGPGAMPSFAPALLSDKQVDSIVEYIKFVKHPPRPGGVPLNWYGPVAEGCVAWGVLFGLILLTGWIEKGEKG